jgi:hypothetical protein
MVHRLHWPHRGAGKTGRRATGLYWASQGPPTARGGLTVAPCPPPARPHFARPHERDAPGPQFLIRLLLGRSHTDRLSGDPHARNARGALADGRLSALSQLGSARLSPKCRVTQQAAMSRPSSFPNRPPGPTWTSQQPTRSGQSRPQRPFPPSMRAFASPLRRVEIGEEGGRTFFAAPM